MSQNVVRLQFVLAVVCALTLISLPAQAGQCSRASLAGSWDYTYTGTVFAPDPLPAAAVGHLHQDAQGNITGTQTHTLAGQTEVEDISGTATVNSNCTGSGTISVYLNGVLLRTATLNSAYDSNGNHGRLIFTSLTLADGTVLPVVITVDTSRVFTGN